MRSALATAAIVVQLFGSLDPLALEVGNPRSGDFRESDIHAYRLRLEAEQFLRISVVRHATDLRVTLYASAGRKLAEIVTLNESTGSTALVKVIDEAGEYRVEVQAQGKKDDSARYTIAIDELRSAKPEDTDRVLSFHALAQGEALITQGTAPALRDAIPAFEQAAQAAQRAGDLELEAGALDHLGLIYRNLSDAPKSLEYLQRGLNLWRGLRHPQGEAHALSIIGGVYNMLGRTQEALDVHLRALELERSAGQRAELASHLTNVGFTYKQLGDPLKAIEFYNQALPLIRADGKALAEGVTLNNIGTAYEITGELQKAIEHYNRALDVFLVVGNPRREAMTLSNLGTVYCELGDHKAGLSYFERSLALRRIAADRQGEAITLGNLGGTYMALGDTQKALSYFKQAELLTQNMGDRRNEALTISQIAAVHDVLGEKQEAVENLERSIQLARATGDRAAEARMLANLGKVQSDLGQHHGALGFLKQALALAKTVRDRSVEIEALAETARAERDLGSLQEARSSIEGALDLIESTRSKIASESLRTSYFASLHHYYEFYIALLMQLHGRFPSDGYDSLALQANERARARGLLDLLSEARVDVFEGIEPALLERSRRLRWRLSAQAAVQNRVGSRNAEETEAARKTVDALTLEYQQLQAEIRQKSPRFAALTQPHPLSTSEIQTKVLDDDTLLLEYSIGNEKSFLWAVARDSIRTFELPARAALGREVSQLVRLINERASSHRKETAKQRRARIEKTESQYFEVAANLSRVLLSPVEPWLQTKRLLVVADGVLQYVPFAALPVPPPSADSALVSGESRAHPARRTPIIADHEIVSLPSASVLAVLRSERSEHPAARRSIAILADPVFSQEDPRLRRASKTNLAFNSRETSRFRAWREEIGALAITRLPFTRREAKGIREVAPEDALEALDFLASRATATNPALAEYRVVHFATHGFIHGDHPELSAVVLSLFNERGEAQDGFLRLQDIYNLKLGADLVVLSACQSGLGKPSRGEGLIGLTRGFMYAGASRVMSTLWRVDDAATAELMQRFYQEIFGKEHLAPSAALRRAQLALWKDARWSFPFFWAPFVISGEWKNETGP